MKVVCCNRNSLFGGLGKIEGYNPGIKTHGLDWRIWTLLRCMGRR